MKKLLIINMVLVFSAILPSTVISQIVMDPSEYLKTARATADIARVIASFNEYVERNDPLFLSHGEVNIPMGGGLISSYAGELTGDFQGFDAFIYLRLFKNEQFSARLFGTWSTFGFYLDDAAMTTPPLGFNMDNRTGWISGYGMVGTQVSVGEDRYTLGAILRYEPTISQGPPAQFSYRYDEEGDFRTTEMSFERMYADASIAGWKLDTLLSLEAIERLAAAKLFDLSLAGLALGPSLQYLGRLGSFRPGFVSEWKPASWFEASIGANAAVSLEGFSLGEATLDLSLPIKVTRKVGSKVTKDAEGGSRRDSKENRDLMLRLDARGSLLGTSAGLVPGGKVEITIDKARGLTIWDLLGLADVFLGASAGVSWNHVDTLARMPFEDQLILYFRIQASVY